ncbi:MAG: hypothetical protein DMG88_04810 [Acidobacteria bacterium]|nr:MAG: hypothetical protein DMG88_04810 [Acidobacteriota bacterium]
MIAVCVAWLAYASAQQASQPQVKVNMLNVCSPSADDQREISSALARVPKQPLFAPDFEVDRGRSSMAENPNFLQPGSGAQVSAADDIAKWVRIRREFSVQALFSTVQYSFSADPKNMIETLVFRVRDPKDLMQVSIEDGASAVTTPAAMLATNTPATRIKLERFGKSSVVLARCYATDQGPAPDQSAYEPLFQSASAIVANYRGLLGARRMVPEELARVGAAASRPKPLGKKSEARKPTCGDK